MKKSRIIVLGLYVMFTFTPLAVTHYFYKDLVSVQSNLILTGINLYTCALAYNPLSLFVIFGILNHYILLFKKILIYYNERIEWLLSNDDRSEMTSVLNDGVKIVKALSGFESTFGGLLVVEAALCLLIEIFGFYFGTMISNFVTNANLLLIFIGFTFVLVGIQGFLRFFILTRNGQYLTNAMTKCQSNLDLLNIQSKILNSGQEKQMTCIMTRFSHPAAWRPYDLFDLGHAASLTVHSVIVTYLVVLIQFKDVQI